MHFPELGPLEAFVLFQAKFGFCILFCAVLPY